MRNLTVTKRKPAHILAPKHFLRYALVLVASKALLMAYVGESASILDIRLFLQELGIAALCASIASKFTKTGHLLISLVAFYTVIAAHSFVTFGGYPTRNMLSYTRNLDQMNASIIPTLHFWLITCSFAGIAWIWCSERIVPWLKDRWAYKALIALTLFLLITTFLAPRGASAFRDAPLTFLAKSFARVDPFKNQDPLSETFSYRSKFSTSKPIPVTYNRIDEPLNVIYLSLESAGSVSMKREGKTVMPQLWSLLEDGIYFENFYANIPTSMKTIFASHSGYDPVPLMEPISALKPDFQSKTLPEYLKDSGYRTALIHSGYFSYSNKLAYFDQRGFDVMLDAATLPNEQGQYEYISWGIDDKAGYDYSKQFALEGDSPFFISFITIGGHHPYNLPASFEPPYGAETNIDKYHSLLAYHDDLIADFIQFLKNENLYKNTLFVIFGDHGEAFGQHPYNYIHTSEIYEENMRIPLIFSNPKLFPENQISSTVGSVADLMPSLLELLGIPLDPQFNGQGHSLFSPQNQKMVFFFTDFAGVREGLRDEHYKYIYNPISNAENLLFDLKRDPSETTNIAEMQPERVIYYRSKIKSWKQHAYNNVMRSQN